MEHKIGEVFELDGEWYQCLKTPNDYIGNICNFCSFSVGVNCISNCQCIGAKRKDNINVFFKKLKKLGEPFEKNGYLYQEYKAHTYPLLMSGDAKMPTSNGFAVIIKQNNEDMKENTNTNVKQTPFKKLIIDFFNNRITDIEFERRVRELYVEHPNSEKIGKDLRPFDLEAAKAGKPVCTRDGRKARIICFDYKGTSKAYPILALITDKQPDGEEYELTQKYTKDGIYKSFYGIPEESVHDLMMLPEKKEGWINIYHDKEDSIYTDENVFHSEEDAIKFCSHDGCKVGTVKIEWEE